MCEDVIELNKGSGLAILTCDSNRRKWNTVMVSLIYSFYQFSVDDG